MVKDSYQNIANGLTNDVLLAISAGLSILGCTLILTTYMCYKEIRTVSRHIVVCISISDIITTASNLSAIFISPEIDSETDEIDNISCTVQSFVGTSAVLWSFLWTMVLAMYLYLDLVKENKTLGKRLIWPWSHLICWIAPLGINMVALFLHKLGNSGDRNTAGWCWISVFVDNYGDAKLWMLVDGKGIELLTYVVIVILYSRMKLWSIRQIKIPKQNEGSHLLQRNSLDAARYTDKKIILIPILFVLLRIWGTIRFFMLLRTETLAFKGDITVFETALLYLQTIGDNLQGAINCILFCCMTPVVRKRINKSVTSMRRQRFHLYDHLDSTSDTSSRIYQPID